MKIESSSLDKLGPDGRTEIVTPWAPDGAKNGKCFQTMPVSASLSERLSFLEKKMTDDDNKPYDEELYNMMKVCLPWNRKRRSILDSIYPMKYF